MKVRASVKKEKSQTAKSFEEKGVCMLLTRRIQSLNKDKDNNTLNYG